MAKTLRQRPQLMLAAALILLACSAVSGIWLALRKSRADEWVRHTFEVKDRLAGLRVMTLRGEVYRRGFLLTGNTHDEITMREIVREIPYELNLLEAMTRDNALELSRIRQLGRLVRQRIVDSDQSIVTWRSGDRAGAIASIGGPANRRATAAIVQLVDGVRAEEDRLLALRLKHSRDLERPIEALAAGTALLVLVLALLLEFDRRTRVRVLGEANARLVADIARREVIESELALLATNATDAVLRLDLTGQCLYASPSIEQVLGVTPERALGRGVLVGVDPAYRDELVEFLHLLAIGEIDRGVITYRLRRPRPSARDLWIEAHCGLVRDADGAPQEIIASLRDVSERKQLDLALEAARARAEAAVRAKSSFLANMSHEIRTPMNGVLGFADLLLHGDLAPEQRRQAQLIVDSSRAMMRLLNDILDLSKIEAGQMQIATERTDLRHVLRNCIKLIEPAAAQKRLALRFEVDERLPRFVLIDGLRLRQVSLNLLGNAVKFTEQGSVSLVARLGGTDAAPRLEVAVSDTGIGIPEDRQAAIFEQFVQAEQTTASRYGGTGLGLAISSQLATLMGGGLSLESRPGAGSSFTLSLPLVAAEDGSAAAAAPAEPAALAQRLRVLVAEDHDVNQLLMREMLSRLGHEADVAENGAEAVAAARAALDGGQPYDLLLMDMQMPVLDGLGATRAIRASGITPAALPILALTANAYADDIAACLEAGMQGHLAKPVQLADLAAAIRQWARPAEPQAAQADPALNFSPKLHERYAARKAELLATAEKMAAAGSFDDADVESLRALLHKLAGSAGMFRQAALGTQAAALEDALELSQAGERPALVGQVIAALRAAA